MKPRLEFVPIDAIGRNPANVRTHSKKQIRQIADSMREFGCTVPLLLDENNMLIAGEGRWEAAKLLGMRAVPAIVVKGLSEAKKKALMLADNKLAANAGWDSEQLAIQLAELQKILPLEGLDIGLTGFDPVEIDALQTDFEEAQVEPSDELDDVVRGPKVSRLGDSWGLHKHRLMCGDARNPEHLLALLGRERASMAFLDVPYNVSIPKVVGRGATKHRDFAMAAGEMDFEQFVDFLRQGLGLAARFSKDGAVHFVCIDWRHVEELFCASRDVYGAALNLIAWVKSNAGQGSFYRSQHELIGVFKVGSATHLNSIQLGRHGRNRSNVWTYAGVNSFGAHRMDDLRAHPTVKPVAMVADALKDCTRRNEAILDTFCGSGTTILAAERVGRRGFGIEIDPTYVDIAIRRWQAMTGRDAVHLTTGLTFDDMGERRRRESAGAQAGSRSRR